MRVVQVLLVLAVLLLSSVPGGLAFSHSVTIASPGDGDSLEGTVTVSGTAHADDGITHVIIGVDGEDFVQVDNKSGTTDATWSHALDTTAYTNGAHTIQVRARDSGGSMVEDAIGVTFVNEVVVDLVVTGVIDHTGIGGGTLVRAAIVNTGSSDAEDAVAAAEYRYQGVWHPIGRITFDLVAGGEALVEVPWDSRFHVGRFPVRVLLDPDDALQEADESNNIGEGHSAFWTDAVAGVWLLWPVSPDPQHWQTKQVHAMDRTIGFVPPVMPTRVTDYLILWNEDDQLHTYTADDGSFDTGDIEPGWFDIVTFDTPGTYEYHCVYHPTMRGTIVVIG